MMIQAHNLTKTFGKVTAVDRINFTVPAGQVFGLLGPNGAGKTTTLRLLATLLQPDSGTATVNGHDIKKEPEKIRSSIGVVNGGMGLYDRLTGREILHYFGQFYGMKRVDIDRRIKELDGLLDLGETLTRQTGGFSTGMKQKIVIARAVIHDPPVIFFDEATSGLDVMARRAVLNFVRQYPSDHRTVVYSTHVMSEVEELCDRVAIIYSGRLIAEDTPQGLMVQAGATNLEQTFFTLVERSGSTQGRKEPVGA